MSLQNMNSFQPSTAVVASNQLAAYFATASLAIAVYDYILTLNLEIGLVWGTPWNIGKVLFFLTRYLVFIDASLLGWFHYSTGGLESIEKCRHVYQHSGWMIFVGIAIAEFVLTFRTWAIWGRSTKIAIGLVALMLCMAIPAMYLTHIGEHTVEFVQSPIYLTQRCLVVKFHKLQRSILTNYIVILALETVILVLTAIKGVQHYRISHSSLTKTLYKDGLLYYVYLTAISLANVGVYASPNKARGASLILLQRVLHSVFTARILLHLRLAVLQDRRRADTSSTPTELTSTIVTGSQRGQLSTVILGVDTWCYSREHPAETRHLEVRQQV